jgi:hypothetical protein
VTAGASVVLVKKAYTSPARLAVTLRVQGSGFDGTGTLSRTGDAIRFFTAATGGTEITFNGTDNVFTTAQLAAPTQVFAEGSHASGAVDDVGLTLTLTSANPVGDPATLHLTAVELTLDIFKARTAAGAAPDALPQPPDPPPAAGSNPTDKLYGGRIVHLQDAGRHHGRARILVHKPSPAAFGGTLVLTGNNASALGGSVEVFRNEHPTRGEHPASRNIATRTIPDDGLELWVQGHTLSQAANDTGLKLGIVSVDPDGDRVGVTVCAFRAIAAQPPFTPPATARTRAAAFAPPTNNAPDSPDLVQPQFLMHLNNFSPPAVAADALARATGRECFDDDFSRNTPLALVEGSIPAGKHVNLSIVILPAGTPVRWQQIARATDDAPGITALNPAPSAVPTMTVDNTVTPPTATLLADSVGSFRVYAYVDTNGAQSFDPTIDRQPFILLNVALLRVQESQNRSRKRAAAPTLTRFAHGFNFSTGNFAGGATAAINNRGVVTVIGGGPDGRRGLDRLFGGWIQHEYGAVDVDAEDVVVEYDDSGTTRQRLSVWNSFVPASLNRDNFGAGGNQLFPQFLPNGWHSGADGYIAGAVAPVRIPGPFLDVSSPLGGFGANTATGTEGGPGPPTPIVKTNAALGQSWTIEMWDSPGDSVPDQHSADAFNSHHAAGPNNPASLPGRLSTYRFNLNFRTDLCFWTSEDGHNNHMNRAAALLYSTAITNRWTIRAAFTFAPPPPPAHGHHAAHGPPVVTVVTAPVVNLDMDRDPTNLDSAGDATRLARPVEGTGLETRWFANLTTLAVDARS